MVLIITAVIDGLSLKIDGRNIFLMFFECVYEMFLQHNIWKYSERWQPQSLFQKKQNKFPASEKKLIFTWDKLGNRLSDNVIMYSDPGHLGSLSVIECTLLFSLLLLGKSNLSLLPFPGWQGYVNESGHSFW